jgi:hypothetical protein
MYLDSMIEADSAYEIVSINTRNNVGADGDDERQLRELG